MRSPSLRGMQQLTVIRGTYLAPLDEVDAHRQDHFAFIDGLLEGGALLAAGRRTTQDGSLLLFRGLDGDGALALLAGDPYVAAGVARYEAEGTFTPGKYAADLAAALGV